MQGHVEVVKILLHHGAHVLVESNCAQTAEEYATANAHHEVVVVLKEYAVNRGKCVAFAMGLQERLGARSRVVRLSADLVRIVLKYVE